MENQCWFGKILNWTFHVAPLGTWFPDLYFDLGKLHGSRVSDTKLQEVNHFYAWRRHDKDKAHIETNGRTNGYFCTSLSYVSTGHT